MMITGISEAKLVGPDRIDVRLFDGLVVTETLPMALRDFLHFGHFLVALRAAMNDGRLPDRRIDLWPAARKLGAAPRRAGA